MNPLLQALGRANAGILEEKIIPVDWERYPTGLVIPRVGEIYISPWYRIAEYKRWAHPTDERWWAERESRDNFDVFLDRYVSSPQATRQPLLLLGHPGAGKSLLTKVLAARLPTSVYTGVRVPLRLVSADLSIRHQIEEALEISTNQRIAWSELAEQSTDTVRVVLLDGLDGLLQASQHDRSGYLEEIAEFQEKEANQRRPVVVIVTSRTVAADRVLIPEGTAIVKLDPFNGHDIADWLSRWRRVNASAIASGTMRELTVNAAGRQPELAEQPLLLLMLALYTADPNLPALDEQMTSAELYGRLLEGFARREAAKDLGLSRGRSPDRLEQRAQDCLDRLAVAALGMFNRGRQDISEEELGQDLAALEPRLMERSRAAEAGQQVISEFFFVTTVGQEGRNGHPRRAYEFLHATFAEYLVARRIVDELVDITARAFSGRRGPTEPDDDLLFALLSHQVLPVRQLMLEFAREIFADLDGTVRQQVLKVLEVLFRTYRSRHGSDRYAAYRPVPPDQVHQLACYSANLVALRVTLEPGSSGIPFAELLRASHSPLTLLEEWKVTPLLWQAGLDADGLQAMPTTKQNDPFQYDVCLSFASEQRLYVSEVAKILTEHDVRVFYDAYEEDVLWGKDLYTHLADIYEKKSRYCIIFASREYARKTWTTHELRSAQARAIIENKEYILPARFDQTEIPGLNRNIGYIDLTKKTPRELADLFMKKLHVAGSGWGRDAAGT